MKVSFFPLYFSICSWKLNLYPDDHIQLFNVYACHFRICSQKFVILDEYNNMAEIKLNNMKSKNNWGTSKITLNWFQIIYMVHYLFFFYYWMKLKQFYYIHFFYEEDYLEYLNVISTLFFHTVIQFSGFEDVSCFWMKFKGWNSIFEWFIMKT